MADVDRDERAIHRSEEGVSVVKTLEQEAFPVLAVAFELRSERNTAATVRLIDPIPESVPANDIGFHAEYGEEFWAIEDETPVFERELRPGEEHITFYAVREVDADTIGPELAEPGLEITPVSEPDAPPAADAPPSADAPPPTDDSSSAADGTTPTPDDASGPPAHEPPLTDEAVPESDTLSIAGSVAAALATELRRGSVAEADRASLREQLELGTDPKRVEALIADSNSQIEALEAVLGEDGTLTRRLERVSEEARALQNRVEDIEERSAANEETVGTLDDDVARLSGDVDAINEEIDRLSDDVRTVEETLSDRLDALDERLDGVSGDIDELTSWREQMGAVFAGGTTTAATTGSDETTDDGTFDGSGNTDDSER